MLALDNARLLEETQLRTDQLRLLQDITATAAAQTRTRELLDEVSQKLQAGLGVQQCLIALVDEDGQSATIVSRSGTFPTLAGLEAPHVKINLDEYPVISQALNSRKSVAFYPEDQKHAIVSGVGNLASSIKAEAVIPLVGREAVRGFICLDSADPGRRFDEEDLRLLDQLSLQITNAIEVALSFEQTTLRAERERLISEAASRMRATLDIETVLKTAVDEIFRTAELSEATIFLASEPEA
jgi:GAF domain-containing protein